MMFSREWTVRKTRKDHICDGCRSTIFSGSAAVKWAGLQEGEFMEAVYHSECREAEIAFNKMHGTLGEDEWISIGQTQDPDDAAWLIENFPIVAGRLNVCAKEAAHG
jgi:hypothetical protein